MAQGREGGREEEGKGAITREAHARARARVSFLCAYPQTILI